MDNVLVVDRERTSGYLVKSILLGRGCGVSLAPTLKDARLKIHTGLFDALVLDLGEPDVELPLVDEVLQLMPGFPIVALFRDQTPSGPFVALPKPLRVSALSDALRQALGRSPSTWNRHNIDVPAVVTAGAPFVECRATAISRHGVLLTPGHDFERLRAFHEFFHARLETDFQARLAFPGGEEEVHGRVGYAEASPDQRTRQVALVLDADREWFDRLTVPAAPAPVA
jgi:DNA-binding response OmpR family regulator